MGSERLAQNSNLLTPQPCQLVIFGAPGDLAWRKLLPAVYNLNVDGALPSHFAVMGFGLPAEGKVEGDPDAFLRKRARAGIERFSRQPLDESHWEDFSRALFFVPGRFDDAKAYEQLKARLETVDQQFGIPGARVYYLAVPPQLVGMCVAHLKNTGLIRPASELQSFSRVIVEKPIGRDLESAQQVIQTVGQAFEESQTYRIDHYLGKETVQNLLVLRFANSIFEPLWNTKYIDHVQITVAEEEGLVQYQPETGKVTGSRVGYYEGVGALRDMVQNHMLQVLCMVCMEPPWSLMPDVVRDAKSGVLNCLRPMLPSDIESNVVRGQYIEGDMFGKRVPGYRKEVRDAFAAMGKPLTTEAMNSTTETYLAMKLYIDNWRWSGVPFYLRT
ncbi:MAG: glucose-6-phosphate dehydrogenase, partial [Gemmataceae bacterium]